MIEAILFDNDGVLVDTERLFFEVTKSAFERMGLHLTEKIWVDGYLGRGKSSREIALDLGGDHDLIEQMLKDRNRQYLRILRQPTPIRPLVRKTLEALSGQGKLAIVTDAHHDQLNLIHDSSALLEFFDVIVTGDDCTHTKPNPEPYLKAMNELGVGPESCLAVEDSQRGLTSAIAAKVACVVVPTELTRTQDFSGALAVEQDISGVLKYVR